VDREGDRIALTKWYDFGSALHARPLFGKDKLATCEVPAGFREKNCHLDREGEIAIDILVEAVEVASYVLK
jgi:hypothetical protein